MKSFGEQLRQHRLRRKMTQQEIADRLGLSSPYIAQMESGFKPPPPQTLVEKISGILHVHPEEKRLFFISAEKERKLQSLVKATRKIGYILAGNKVCVPQKSVSYRVQQEVDNLVDAIPKNLSFSVDAFASSGKKHDENELAVLQSLDDLRSWMLTELDDRPNVWLTFLGMLYEVLILTPDEKLLCRNPSKQRNELLASGKEVGVYFRKLRSLFDQAKTSAEDHNLPNLIAPHEAWRDIDQALGPAHPEIKEVIPRQAGMHGGIRPIPIIAVVNKGSEEFELKSGLGNIGLPENWFTPEFDYEACLVQSDSYISLGVWPGCKVIYELYGAIKNEDLVVVQLGDRRCIRKYFDLGEQLLLQGGPLSKPVHIAKSETSVRIVGVIRELISRFKELQY